MQQCLWFNPNALRNANTPQSFGRSECDMVKEFCQGQDMKPVSQLLTDFLLLAMSKVKVMQIILQPELSQTLFAMI